MHKLHNQPPPTTATKLATCLFSRCVVWFMVFQFLFFNKVFFMSCELIALFLDEEKLQLKQAIKKRKLSKGSRNHLTRDFIEEEEGSRSIVSNWAFNTNESHYSSETKIVFYTNDTEQHFDDLSDYQEFETSRKSL
jgi:hypothetical protein